MATREVRLAVLFALSACSETPASDGGPADRDPLDAGPSSDTQDEEDRGQLFLDRGFRPLRDAQPVLRHDAGPPPSCLVTCDCPQGLACLDGLCQTRGLGPVWCCENGGCPIGANCLDQQERPARCLEVPDGGPDAGADGGPDAKPIQIGSACAMDSDCNQAAGHSCWEEFAPLALWGGYCTVQVAQCTAQSCPAGATCITFTNGAGGTLAAGCMRNCAEDSDCRSDHFCRQLPNSQIRVCFPECRDDLFDCGLGSDMFCNRMSGRCETTPMQNPNAGVGDPCADNRSCGPGDVCMGEVAWGFVGGLCTRICGGLMGACSGGETCHPFAGVNMCFRDCDGAMMCPDRPAAFCLSLEAGWVRDACIPF